MRRVPWLDEVGACGRAMLDVLGKHRECRQCGYVKGEGKCLTCNTSYIHL
jgi:hypothetical protein